MTAFARVLTLVSVIFFPAIAAYAQVSSASGSAFWIVLGSVTDPQSNPVAEVRVLLRNPQGGEAGNSVTNRNGQFTFTVQSAGTYILEISAPGFQQVSQTILVKNGSPSVADVRLGNLAANQESITVTADLKDSSVLFLDPAQRVYVRQELPDANPGRPGAPISIPGLPIETASEGIKAPQYFAPGVAGDHGEPIAEYIQVGTYLVSNNLSSNAHGNGYADPNIMVPSILAGVQTDGGTFNVREGSHAENLSTIYQLHSRLEPFVTLTGDYRDGDVVAGWSPGSPQTDAWIALEAAYGNGF